VQKFKKFAFPVQKIKKFAFPVRKIKTVCIPSAKNKNKSHCQCKKFTPLNQLNVFRGKIVFPVSYSFFRIFLWSYFFFVFSRFGKVL
jgi:hypothetical protein